MSASTGCMLGWYDGNGYSGTNGLQDMETLLGTRFAVVRVYNQWWPDVSGVVTTATNDGRLVMSSHKAPKNAGSWIEIARGDHDSAITSMVNFYKAFAPEEVIFVFHHEPHGHSSDEGSKTPVYGKMSDFVQAYRRIAKAFHDAAATNVRLGYCAVDSDANNYPHDPGYPGDDVVDVLCHDVYNWGGYPGFSAWKDPTALYTEFVAIAKAAKKPVIFGEIGCHPDIGVHDRGQWLQDLAAFLKTGDAASYILGFCYYHVDNHNGSGHYWRFAQGSTADAAADFTTKFSQDSAFLTRPIAVSLRKAAPPAEVPPTAVQSGGGIPSNIGFGAATVTLDSGPITVLSVGAIPAPADYQDPEESPGLDFGVLTVTFSSPEPGLEGDFFFEPPTVDDVGPVPADWLPIPALPRGRPEQRLFAHMKSRARGRTVILLKTGDAFATDYPVQQVPPWQETGDPFTESGLAGYPYTDIARVFLGGHVDIVNSDEATLLTAAGFGDGLTPIPAPPPRQLHWGALADDTWLNFFNNYGTWG